MVKLVFLYGHPEDPDAFDTYFDVTHTPLVERIPNLRRFECGKVASLAAAAPCPYYFMAELWFDDDEQMRAALASSAGQVAAEDTAQFATGGVTSFIVAC